MSVSSLSAYQQSDKRYWFSPLTSTSPGYLGYARFVIPGIVSGPSVYSSGGSIMTPSMMGIPNPGAGFRVTRAKFMHDGGSSVTESTAYGNISVGLYDAVWAASGFNPKLTTEQVVSGFPALTRPDANGSELEPYIMCWGSPASSGSAGTIARLKFTAPDDTTGCTVDWRGGSTTNLGMFVYQLHAQAFNVSGYAGVKAVESLQFTPNAPTSLDGGDVWALLVKPLARFVTPFTEDLDLSVLNMSEPLVGDECLVLIGHDVGTTQAPNLSILLEFSK